MARVDRDVYLVDPDCYLGGLLCFDKRDLRADEGLVFVARGRL